MAEHVDVLVIGAGLSGVAAGYYLQTNSPDRTYAILEMREAIGGTWDLFKYPGFRCDSDMFSLGYPFRPWPHEETIADGDSIREYIEDTAREFGIHEKIRFGHKVVSADWSSDDARWTVVAQRTDTGERVEYVARFVIGCSGYYDYEEGYTPDFPGRERFEGTFVHPQFWPQDLDYTGQRVVVIGSGATAVTLVPAMTDRAAKVTMLQRSPSYVVTLKRSDPLTKFLRQVLPEQTAFDFIRWKNTVTFSAFYHFCRAFPKQARALLIKGVKEAVGEDYDVDTHFNPRYEPWDERLCLVPDADLFEAIKSGKAEVVTDHIETFTSAGIRLESGRELPADVVVSATGLKVKVLGGVQATVDGEPVSVSDTMFYRGAMFSDIPNFAMVIGYTNASWTLKVELVHEYVTRLLNYMRDHDYDAVVPRVNDDDVEARPLIHMTSGYFARAKHLLPKNGSKMPWKLYQNYFLDRVMLRRGKIEDGSLEFSRARGRRSEAA